MNKKIIIVISLIIVLLFGAIMLWENYDKEKNTSKEGARIVVYQEGKSTKLNPEAAYFKELQEKCESLFINADSALNLIVTNRVISQAKENTAIEIIYSEPKEFIFQTAKPYALKVDAILISFLNNNATIYYSMGGSYSSGPSVNTKKPEVEECQSTLQEI